MVHRKQSKSSTQPKKAGGGSPEGKKKKQKGPRGEKSEDLALSEKAAERRAQWTPSGREYKCHLSRG